MQFTKCGQTGLTVSRMILGTGTFGKQTDEKEAHRMLDKAAEAGINFIDIADVPGIGASANLKQLLGFRKSPNSMERQSRPYQSLGCWRILPLLRSLLAQAASSS